MKLSAFSFIDSQAININKLRRYIYVPRHSLSVHWASSSSINSQFPRKWGTKAAWLVGKKKKNPKWIKAIMSEKISDKIAAVATCAPLLDIRMRTFSCGELPTHCSRSDTPFGFSERRASSPQTRKIKKHEKQSKSQTNTCLFSCQEVILPDCAS